VTREAVVERLQKGKELVLARWSSSSVYCESRITLTVAQGQSGNQGGETYEYTVGNRNQRTGEETAGREDSVHAVVK
jgi:hypothetical protein